MSINGWIGRINEGVAKPIPPSEFIAWATISGNIVDPTEFEILHDMDLAFCEMMNKEMQDYRDRRTEAAKAEAANKGRKGKR